MHTSQGQREHSTSLNLREFADSQFTGGTLRRITVCCSHLERSLDRSVTTADLTRDNIEDVLTHLADEGRQPATINRLTTDFRTLCKAAVAADLIRSVPTLPKAVKVHADPLQPWPALQLSRLILSARSLSGTVSTIPAGKFWSALILTQVDTGFTVAECLALETSAFDKHRGTLACGLLIYELHPLTIEALDALSPYGQSRQIQACADDSQPTDLEVDQSGPKVLPWDKDNGEAPFYMLYRKFKEILYRADLPHVSANLFERLRVTSNAAPRILNRLNLAQPFKAKPGQPHFRRTRQRRTRRRISRQSTDLVSFSALPAESLAQFYENDYRVIRLAGKSQFIIGDYRCLLRRLTEFTGFEPTFDDLTEEHIEHFLAWLAQNDRANETVNRYRAMALALWRHAWRRKKVEELPRDVTKFDTTKRNPEAWSQAELSNILEAARETTGDVYGIPAGDWWFALILTLYETGLRIQATLELKTTDIDFKTGWLTIPADHQKQKAEQVFPLHSETLDAILRIEPHDRILLFPALAGSHTLRKRYREILQRAGLTHGPRDLFHRLRRTSATFVANAIGEEAAQKHMGHSVITVTRKYLDLRKIKSIHPVDVLPRPNIERREDVA